MKDSKNNLGDNTSKILGHLLKITFFWKHRNNVLENLLYQYENELVDAFCSVGWVSALKIERKRLFSNTMYFFSWFKLHLLTGNE